MGIGPITLRTGLSAKGRSAPVVRPIADWGHKPKRVSVRAEVPNGPEFPQLSMRNRP
jgi:hypothetical protein